MAGEVSKLAERQAKLEGENKQIGQRVSNVEQDQRNLAGRMDDKFEVLLSRVDNTLSELRQDHKDLSNRMHRLQMADRCDFRDRDSVENHRQDLVKTGRAPSYFNPTE